MSELTKLSDDEILNPLQTIADHAYMFQGCQVLRYDPGRREIFGDEMLSHLYWQTRNNTSRTKLGALPALMCGMTDLSHDAIVSYFHQRGVVLMGEWRANPSPVDPENPLPDNLEELTHPQFHVLGYVFLSTNVTYSTDRKANSVFGGYCFFREAYRTPQQTVLTHLGLSYLFHELSLVNLHGVRYADNKLTARLMEKFGFQDIGTIPNYMIQQSTGQLVDGVVSTLSRAEFENRLMTILLSLQE
jgi:hypothetical protein